MVLKSRASLEWQVVETISLLHFMQHEDFFVHHFIDCGQYVWLIWAAGPILVDMSSVADMGSGVWEGWL